MAEDNQAKSRRIPRLRRGLWLCRGPGAAGIDWGLFDGRGRLSRAIAREIEQRRLFPWIAVCFGIGILLFFQADGTPALWAPIGAFAISCIGAFVLRGRVWALSATIALAAIFAGFAAGAIADAAASRRPFSTASSSRRSRASSKLSRSARKGSGCSCGRLS